MNFNNLDSLSPKFERENIQLGLSRIKKALFLLGNPHLDLKRPCNILGSDGKFSCLTSLKYFIEANNQTTSAYISPSLKDIKERFWMGENYLSYQDIRKTIKFIESLKTK